MFLIDTLPTIYEVIISLSSFYQDNLTMMCYWQKLFWKVLVNFKSEMAETVSVNYSTLLKQSESQ